MYRYLIFLLIVGTRYQHFVKFQNLIDLAYIQLTTNKSIWPMFNWNEIPSYFNDSRLQCLSRLEQLPEQVWVGINAVILIIETVCLMQRLLNQSETRIIHLYFISTFRYLAPKRCRIQSTQQRTWLSLLEVCCPFV